ncbi:DNA topoisomerase I [Metamycoplasma hyosynoviae]|uniref:type I DNA topoisomerase n=1 Tax=Metamycoplasma hyosynoviae TaxID=29559 RepID=UPI00046143E1|nr:type I DNA topoisomerase [Metamycoplasma hyosynoviae]KDE41839.1 DNA topoisomerase I [Metamycoplasma hyosynoviae]KDE42644.1 DNA topoisomerase I [Metamycoplasma hyosynoviae]KDE43749.1 DNA topoisomerase I [Metamycoplasma hyosynoviae]KDE44841.1 DNA topoisomerase I [Metamycoplasma hyosynoviae]KDE45445.1 DNA topoisomerase I [Metamycoplasma hyosynoviae]
MSNKLMIVESPNKVKTIQRYLGDDFTVLSSVGHILKMKTVGENQLGIDFDNWEPLMAIDSSKTKIIKDLKEAAKKSDLVYVATDPDREGEAIAQNLVDVLKIENKYKRIKYNEITKEAIEAAIENPILIDTNLVNAQKTRRMLDRIIGFKLSQLIKTKIKNAPTIPSAGRVQSIALKLVCDREREINAFVPIKYSKIEAMIKGDIVAVFYYPEDKDFANDNTWISPEKSEEILKNLNIKKLLRVQDLKISKRKESQVTPFKQSVLYKEAKYASQVVQSSAQKLFENGLISYPRTDSTRLSASFVSKAKKYIEDKFGADYIADEIKGVAGDQDAHEAIRPTDIYLTPQKATAEYSLDETDSYIYELIYNKTICSIMKPPVREIYHYDLIHDYSQNNYFFKISYSKIIFDGYYKVIGTEAENNIPSYKIGDVFDVNEFSLSNKETQPPARYNDGSLIKMLDDIKVGRPSTFATTVAVIKKRLFVQSAGGNSLQPTAFGIAVLEKLIEGFPKTINEEYTASVEEELDKISEGNENYKEVLARFWHAFTNSFESATNTMEISIIPQEFVNEKCPTCGNELIYRYTKKTRQKFIGCSNFPACHYLRNIEDQKSGFKMKWFKKKLTKGK